jgi:hypothetical protein
LRSAKIAFTIASAAFSDVRRNGRTCSPDLAGQAKKLLVWEGRRDLVHLQRDLMRFFPHLKLSEITHWVSFLLLAKS